MKNSDEAIEKVMAGLCSSEPPAGLELRILAAAKDRQSAQPASGRLREKPLWLLALSSQQRAWRAALAATTAAFLLAALAIIPAIHSHPKPATQSYFHPNVTVMPTPVDTRKTASLPHPNPIEPAGIRPHQHTARLLAVAHPMHPHETRNLSHPAPEEPLTQQEKLLLRVAQSGSPHVFAMLNTEIRTRREAEEDAEFQRFADQSVASPNGDSE